MKNIDHYLDGNLSSEEMEKMTKKLIEEQIFEEKRKTWAKELERTHSVRRDVPILNKKSKNRRIWFSIAAAILIILISFPVYNAFYSTTPSSIALAEDLLANPFPNNELRKGQTDIDELKVKAITAYNTKNYEEAVLYYEQVSAQGQMSETDYLFLGLSYLYGKNQDVNQAVANLESAQKAVTNKYEEETNLYLSLALIKQGAQDKAHKILQKIVETKAWKYKDAEKILRQSNAH